MQRAEIEREQAQFKQQIKELKAQIAYLINQRHALEQEHQRASSVMQKLSRYVGFGANGQLAWVNFKLKFKQKQLAALVLHPEEEKNGVAKLLSLVPPPQSPPVEHLITAEQVRNVSP